MNANLPSTEQVMKSNPLFTFGQAVGFSIGVHAAFRKNQFESLSQNDWIYETSDYADGYRKGFKHGIKLFMPSLS